LKMMLVDFQIHFFRYIW